MPAKRTGDTAISNDAVKAKTGKTWSQWFAILDKWGGKKKPHKEIALYLHEQHGVPGWWSQMLTVEYERKRRLRKVGELADGKYSLDVQRTIQASARDSYDKFLDPKHVSKWFTTKAAAQLKVGGRYSNADGDQGEFLALDPPKRARLTWGNPKHCPGTVIELTVRPAGKGKVAVRLTHAKLKKQKDREEMKQGWSWALDSFKSYVETGKPIHHEDWLKAQ